MKNRCVHCMMRVIQKGAQRSFNSYLNTSMKRKNIEIKSYNFNLTILFSEFLKTQRSNNAEFSTSNEFLICPPRINTIGDVTQKSQVRTNISASDDNDID